MLIIVQMAHDFSLHEQKRTRFIGQPVDNRSNAFSSTLFHAVFSARMMRAVRAINRLTAVGKHREH